MLSESVSKALTLRGGRETDETARFLLMMDTFFDRVNVHNFTHGFRAAEPFQMLYWSADDQRVKVCKRLIPYGGGALTMGPSFYFRSGSVRSQQICQDPLEIYFGCQRQRGGTHDNPNMQEVQKNMQALGESNQLFC